MKKRTHGGKRKGQGRPKDRFVNTEKKEPTKVIRVRVSKLSEIKKINQS